MNILRGDAAAGSAKSALLVVLVPAGGSPLRLLLLPGKKFGILEELDGNGRPGSLAMQLSGGDA
jgi:hypothetical protein